MRLMNRPNPKLLYQHDFIPVRIIEQHGDTIPPPKQFSGNRLTPASAIEGMLKCVLLKSEEALVNGFFLQNLELFDTHFLYSTL